MQTLMPHPNIRTSYYIQNLSDLILIMMTLNKEKFFNSSFHQKIESVQYNTCLAITGARKGVSEENLYDKLGLEPLQLCRWFKKSCYFYKFYKNESPQYLFKLGNLRHFS